MGARFRDSVCRFGVSGVQGVGPQACKVHGGGASAVKWRLLKASALALVSATSTQTVKHSNLKPPKTLKTQTPKSSKPPKSA